MLMIKAGELRRFLHSRAQGYQCPLFPQVTRFNASSSVNYFVFFLYFFSLKESEHGAGVKV